MSRKRAFVEAMETDERGTAELCTICQGELAACECASEASDSSGRHKRRRMEPRERWSSRKRTVSQRDADSAGELMSVGGGGFDPDDAADVRPSKRPRATASPSPMDGAAAVSPAVESEYCGANALLRQLTYEREQRMQLRAKVDSLVRQAHTMHLED